MSRSKVHVFAQFSTFVPETHKNTKPRIFVLHLTVFSIFTCQSGHEMMSICILIINEKEEELVREGRSRGHKTETTIHVTCDSFQSELIAFMSHVNDEEG